MYVLHQLRYQLPSLWIKGIFQLCTKFSNSVHVGVEHRCLFHLRTLWLFMNVHCFSYASILIIQLGILGGLLGRGFLLLVLGPHGSQALDSTFGRVPKHSLLILERIVIGAPMTHFIGVIFGVLLCITVGVVVWALKLLIQTLLSNVFDLRRV